MELTIGCLQIIFTATFPVFCSTIVQWIVMWSEPSSSVQISTVRALCHIYISNAFMHNGSSVQCRKQSRSHVIQSWCILQWTIDFLVSSPVALKDSSNNPAFHIGLPYICHWNDWIRGNLFRANGSIWLKLSIFAFKLGW